jgi:hypothetical protein
LTAPYAGIFISKNVVILDKSFLKIYLFDLASVREKMIQRLISRDESSTIGLSEEQKLFVLQRKARASLIKDFIDSCDGTIHPSQGNLSNLLSR